MLFQLFSDIHLELIDTFPMIPVKAPYLILAGDIGKYNKSSYIDFLRYVSAHWEHIFYVFGNHEFYIKRTMNTVKTKYIKLFSEFPNIHLLDNSHYKISETLTIYGFTCWTLPCFETTMMARAELNDFNFIRTNKGLLTNKDVTGISTSETEKFKDFLLTNEDDLLIITHFPPINIGTSDPMYDGTGIINKYFKWDNYIEQHNCRSDKIKYWCSGHTHWSYNFEHNGITYISNQIGYNDENISYDKNGLLTIKNEN